MLFRWTAFCRAAFCREKESAYDLRMEEAFREKAKYGGQHQTEEVIEPTHISKHHENVVDDAFLVLNFVWQVDHYHIDCVWVIRFTDILIEVQIIDFFWRWEPQKV